MLKKKPTRLEIQFKGIVRITNFVRILLIQIRLLQNVWLFIRM